MLKKKLKLFFAACLSGMALLVGLQIIVFGRSPGRYGDYTYDGWERLFGLWPIALGVFLLLAIRHKWKALDRSPQARERLRRP
jgi:hypothetical protein